MPDIISKGVRSDSLIFYLIKILQVTINEASKRKHIFQVFCIFIFHKLDFNFSNHERRITAVYMIGQEIIEM